MVTDGRTSTQVIELDRQERTREVARMLAGAKITDSAFSHAAEMLAAAASPSGSQ